MDSSPAQPEKSSAEQIAEYRFAWEKKPVLRAVYRDCYERMAALIAPGPTLEIGGGSGNFKQFAPSLTDGAVVSTDIIDADWLDAICDAQALPFADGSFANIVMFDVLHHVERPRRFFEEARRVLRPGGRIVLMEPGITPVSNIFYTHFHPEPVDMSEDVLTDALPSPDRDPYDANQGIPTLLFGRQKPAFDKAFPELSLVAKHRLSLFAYPLSGGFRPWSLIPAWMVKPVLAVERVLLPVLGWLMAFRLLVVLERT